MVRLPVLRARHFFLVAAAVFAADQLSKAIARSFLPYTANTGTVLGALHGTNLVFAVLTAIVLLLLFRFVRLFAGRPESLPAALIAGGAAGNLADRVLFGGVTDFIVLGRFPSFNLADAALTGGALLLMLQWLKNNKR